MKIGDNKFQKPYSVKSGGKETGPISGNSLGVSADQVILSVPGADNDETLKKMETYIGKSETLIKKRESQLVENSVEIKPEEEAKLKDEIKKLENGKVVLLKEKESMEASKPYFAKMGVKGHWKEDGEEFDLLFSDNDNSPNLTIDLDVGYTTKKPFMIIDNKGKKGSDDHLEIVISISSPINDEKAIDNFIDEIPSLIEAMPSDVKSVEVKKNESDSSHTTEVKVKGDKGDDFAFKIVDGKIQK